METVALVLCWLGILQSLQLASYLPGKPQHLLYYSFSAAFQLSITNFTNLQGIEAFKKILRDPEKEYPSNAGIDFERGFNSLSSFNDHFKKNIRITPSEFKKARNKVLSRT